MQTRERVEQLRKQLEIAVASGSQPLSAAAIVALSQKLDEHIVKEMRRLSKYTRRKEKNNEVTFKLREG